MRFEIKIGILSLVFSMLCMVSFTYACSLSQKKMYVYQVGIYKEATNKDEKLTELKNAGFEGFVYEKDGQSYVLSMISENYDEIKEHSSKVQGIIKEYSVSSDTTVEQLLENLAKGQSS